MVSWYMVCDIICSVRMSMWYCYSIIIYIEGWYLASVWVCDGIIIYGIMIYIER